MKAKDLLKKYPDFWARIETDVWDDVKMALEGIDVPATALRRIAYNAAFYATYEHHKALKVKK